MNVVRLASYRSRATVEVLEALAAKARAGEIVGLALCYEAANGTEDALFTGRYASSPDVAAAATLRLSMKLAASHGEYERSP